MSDDKALQGVEVSDDVSGLASMIDGLPPPSSSEEVLPALPEVAGAESLDELLEAVDDDEDSSSSRTTRTRSSGTRRRGGRSAQPKELSPPRPSAPMKKILPSNEQVIVKKREDGKLGYIGSFSTADLSGAGSIEHFLGRYIVPKWKHGEYFLFLSKDGKEVPYGSVYMMPPDPEAMAADKDQTSLRDIIEMQERMASRTKEEASSQLDGLAKLLAMMKMDEGKASPADMMQMMLLKTMIEPQRPSGPDPMVTAILNRLEKMEQQNQYTQMMAAQPLPPPPPPPPDPMMTIAPLLASFMESQARMFEALKPAPQKERDVLSEINTIATMLKSGEGDKITLKDLPALKEMFIPKGGDDEPFDRLMKEMKAIHLLRTEIIGENREPGMLEQIAGALLPALLNSSVGDRVKEAVQGAQQQQQQTQQPSALPQGARAPQPKEEEETLEIPQEWEQHARNIVLAETSSDRLNAAVHGLQVLAKYDGFRPYVVNIVGLMRANKKKQALKSVRHFFSGLAEADAFDKDTIDKLVEDLHIYWMPVCHAMGYRHAEDPDPHPTMKNQAPFAQEASSREEPNATPEKTNGKSQVIDVASGVEDEDEEPADEGDEGDEGEEDDDEGQPIDLGPDPAPREAIPVRTRN